MVPPPAPTARIHRGRSGATERSAVANNTLHNIQRDSMLRRLRDFLASARPEQRRHLPCLLLGARQDPLGRDVVACSILRQRPPEYQAHRVCDGACPALWLGDGRLNAHVRHPLQAARVASDSGSRGRQGCRQGHGTYIGGRVPAVHCELAPSLESQNVRCCLLSPVALLRAALRAALMSWRSANSCSSCGMPGARAARQ